MKSMMFIKVISPFHPTTGMPLEGTHYAVPGGGIALRSMCEAWGIANQIAVTFRDREDQVFK